MKIMALVTAKSTSTRVAYKNKRVLHGRPLYKWTTNFLNDNRSLFDSLVFSSDFPYGFNVGDGWLRLVRPPELLLDSSPHLLSVAQCLRKTEKINNVEYSAVFLFQPTNPFRDVKMLYHAMSLFINHNHKDPEVPYQSNCMYRDSNLSKSYIHGAQFQDNIVVNPMIKSGSLYVYNRSFLLGNDHYNARYKNMVVPKIHTNTKYMHMIIPKVWGYNINDGLDIKIVETLMRESGVKYAGRC